MTTKRRNSDSDYDNNDNKKKLFWYADKSCSSWCFELKLIFWPKTLGSHKHTRAKIGNSNFTMVKTMDINDADRWVRRISSFEIYFCPSRCSIALQDSPECFEFIGMFYQVRCRREIFVSKFKNTFCDPNMRCDQKYSQIFYLINLS